MTPPSRGAGRVVFLSIALLAVTGCGGGGSTPPPPPPAMYSIGGTVSGLDAGQSVTLQLNGSTNPASIRVDPVYALVEMGSRRYMCGGRVDHYPRAVNAQHSLFA